MTDKFNEAMAHHRAGRLDLAAGLYRSILAQIPDHADSLNLLGVIAHQQGNDAQAVELIYRAVQIRSDRPAFYVNLAASLRGLKRYDDAVKCCQAALNVQPDLTEAFLNLGLAHQGASRWAEAELAFRWMLEHRPNDSRGPQALAGCLRLHGRSDEAIVYYRRALTINPNDSAALLGLGTELLIADANPGAAEPFLKRATELLPREVTAWTNYGSCLVKLGREREALKVFEEAMQLAPNDPALGCNIGQAWLGCGNRKAAENCFQAVLRFYPLFPAAQIGLADVKREGDRIEEAIPLYEMAYQYDPDGASYKGLADALWDFGDVTRAVSVLQKGIARHPRDAENHVRLAMILESGGDLKGAEESCRSALRIRAGHPPALVELALNLRAKLPEPDRQLLEKALEQPASDPAHAAVHFGLAHVADAKKEYAGAAEHLQKANSLMAAFHKSRDQGYDPEQMDHYVDRLIEVFSPSFFAKVEGFGVSDERPVFVVGMPRSGTTLIEQILASHPQVFGAGERRFAFQSFAQIAEDFGQPGKPLDCFDHLTPETVRRLGNEHLEQLRRLDGGQAARIVDKMPDNYTLLGWLALLFPKARFIHSRRDVRDIALSCWITNFSKINWANDLQHIARRILAYQRIMDHWRKVLPVAVLEMDYERLVADQEPESRRLVDWLGLEWDPSCLHFYQSDRLVKTASVTQVRQPMYSRSIGRWKHYREALKPFLEALGTEPE